MIIWAIIPVKPLRDSKSRLSNVLSSDERVELTRSLLRRTLKILDEVPLIDRTLVVSRDPCVLKLARQHGALTYAETDKQDMNTALTRASHVAAAKRADAILILPSDLPLMTVEDVEMVVEAGLPDFRGGVGYRAHTRAIAICPDLNEDGTNALFVYPPTGFTFKYGPESYSLHVIEAARLGMSWQIVHAPGMKLDLDTEDDWRAYQAMQVQSLIADPV
jgi:2-phospho-L-lactate guanylyltransferase